MILPYEDLQREAAGLGFQVEPLEKVMWLVEVLNALQRHPFLKERLALKGGTALNLFVFELPRLSVDIDLNYIGAVEREVMLQERPQLEEALRAVLKRLNIEVRRIATEHAGGKWHLAYVRDAARRGALEIDLNFILRAPLWPVRRVDSRPVGAFVARQIPLLDLHELASGKLAALFGRTASRDLYDAHHLLHHPGLDPARLRLGFVVYLGAQREDLRTIRLEQLRVDPAEVQSRLLPVLHREAAPGRAEVPAWTQRLLDGCLDGLATLLPLRDEELEFLTGLTERGEIAPELLTTDARIQEVIRLHPALRWKALNVRKHCGLPDEP